MQVLVYICATLTLHNVMINNKHLPFWVKLLYGSGDFGISSVYMLRSIFYALYLTDIVGLEPRLASFGGLIGVVWDAVNDPIIGLLTDRMRSRLGRRRPFLLWFAIPFGLSFILLWSAPNWDNQIALLVYVTLSFMVADTLQSLIYVPYLSLTPELAPDYDDRTSLTGFRSFFQLFGSLAVALAAPNIIDRVIAAGFTQQQGYMLVGAIFGGIGIIPLLLIGLFIKETATPQQTEALPLGKSIRVAWKNIPFRYGVAIHLLNWSASDMIVVIFPFFMLYWVAGGDQLASIRILGFDLAYESAFFGIMLVVCILFIRFWMWLARVRNKREAYMLGMGFWVIVQFMVFTIQPGQVTYMLIIAGLAGIGVSAAYTLPDALFSDVIEWDELRTGRRQEGMYFGVRAFIRKVTGAIVIFITLQALGWSGYQAPPDGVIQFAQPESALMMIRLLASPFGAVMLAGVIVFTALFPLTRERYNRMQKLLERKRARGMG